MSKRTRKPGEFVTVFSDASFCQHTGSFGWAVWIKHGDPPQTIRLSGGGCGSAKTREGLHIIETSDQAERFAADLAIRALAYYEVDCTGKIVVLRTDCLSICDRVDITPVWGNAKAVHIKHVKGHRGHRNARSSVNTWCDKTARAKMVEHRARVAKRTG